MQQRRLNVEYRIQHAQGRDGALARLLERLPPAVRVVTDEEAAQRPNPWRGYLKCLQIPATENTTHICVIQDDALPCKDFDALLKEAIGERPDDVISLFVGGLPSNTRKQFYEALKRGDRWSPIYFREIHHVVALVWPVHHAVSFVEWVANNKIPGPNPPKSDDAVVGYWARKNRNTVQVWATVPCLVEHPDDFPSLVQGTNRFSDRGRRAIAFRDDLT